jgi:PAS domain S-box-containing protein
MSQARISVIGSPARLDALRRLALLDSPAEPAFDRLTQLAAKILRAPVVLVSLVDADRQFLKSSFGLAAAWATLREIPLSHSFCQYAVDNGAPLIIDDAGIHPLIRDNPAIPDLNIVAYAGIPLITREGYALGSFCAIDSAPRAWTDEEIAILEDLAAAVMTEIELRAEINERKQAEEAARRLAEQRKRLLEVAQTVVSTLTLDEILPKLQRTLQEILEYDSLGVYWLDEGAGVLSPAHTAAPTWFSDQASTWSIPLGSGIAGAVGRSGRAELVNDAHRDPRSIYPPGTTSAQPHHMICVPIQTNDRVGGVLIMGRHSSTPFTEQEFDLVQLFVSFVALAIENARLFEQTRKSEERFSKIFRASPVAFTITSLATGRFIEVNQAFIDLMGYSRDEVIGHTTIELDAWPNPAERARIVQTLQEQHSIRSLELAFRTKSGAMIETLASMEIIELGGERCILSLTQDITNHKRAEAALAEQHSFRAAIIERAAEGLCVCHAIDSFPYVAFTVWNDRMIELTGYTMEQINARGWYQSLYPDAVVQARAIERMERMRHGEDLLAEEWEIARADGAKRVVTISTSLLATADGSTHVLALMQDVTERKRAEAALRESEERFAKAFRASPVASCISTLAEGRYLDVNDSFVRLLGYTRDEVIGHTSTDLRLWVDSADRPRMAQRLREYGAIYDLETRTRTKSGELRDTLTSLELIDLSGERCILALFHDITERRQAEQALRESEERFKAIYEHAPVMIDAFTDDGRCLLWNVECEKQLGYSAAEIQASADPLPLFYPDLELRAAVLQSITKPDGIFRECLVQTKDGSLRDQMWANFALPNNMIIGVGYDITERRQAEQEQQRLIHDLQEAIANVKTLRGLLPICSSCKKIRDDHGYWNQIETYITTHSEADFTHGICPDCTKRLYGELYDE